MYFLQLNHNFFYFLRYSESKYYTPYTDKNITVRSSSQRGAKECSWRTSQGEVLELGESSWKKVMGCIEESSQEVMECMEQSSQKVEECSWESSLKEVMEYKEQSSLLSMPIVYADS